MADEDLLAHVHIIKTAGTSLWKWFARTLAGGHGLVYPSNVPDSYYLDEAKLITSGIGNTAVRSVSSHYFRLFPARAVGRRMRYFTLLREPLAHYLSYCNYLRQIYRDITDPETLAALPPDADRLSAREFTEWVLEQRNDIPFRENYQTNYLTSYVWRTATGRGPRPEEPLPVWDAADWAAYRSERIELGKRVLRAFAAVGVVERMHDSVIALSRRAATWGLHIDPATDVWHDNATPVVQQDLSWIDAGDPVGRRLLASFEDDRTLYAFAETLLDEALRGPVAS
jgi:hypothetical protein